MARLVALVPALILFLAAVPAAAEPGQPPKLDVQAAISALATQQVYRAPGAIAHYENALALPLPDKLPMPLTVHRHNGEPCPRCGDQLEAVFYEDYVMCYCPTCQTEGKLMKDRRLSRLLK